MYITTKLKIIYLLESDQNEMGFYIGFKVTNFFFFPFPAEIFG